MQAILGGLGAALAFAGATLCSSRSSRLIGPASVLAWVTVVGLVIVGPWVAVEGVPDGLDAAAALLLGVAGLGSVAGLLLAYAALRVGDVGLVAPILSIQGALAALIAVAAGERLGGPAAATLAVIALGVVLAARPAAAGRRTPVSGTGRPAALALASALAFGATLYATGRVGVDLSVGWALLPARLVGVAGVAVPLVLAARLRLTRRAAPLVLVGGLCEIAGFGCLALGARDSIATTSVISSQFAGLAALAAALLFRERLGRIQIAGVVIIAVGVATLGALPG